MAKAKKDLKASIEDEIQKMLAAETSPDEGRMKLLALGIKMCALNAKLEESEYGDFFNDDPDPGNPQKGKHSTGLRANGTGSADPAG